MTDENMLVPPEIRDRLLAMIADYQQRVARFVSAAEVLFGEDDLLAASLAGRLPEEGHLDDAQESAFRFHGAGCEVKTLDAKVDFDFGPEGRHDGFDAWRLHIFAQSQPQVYPEFQDMAVVAASVVFLDRRYSLEGKTMTDANLPAPMPPNAPGGLGSPHVRHLRPAPDVPSVRRADADRRANRTGLRPRHLTRPPRAGHRGPRCGMPGAGGARLSRGPEEANCRRFWSPWRRGA